MTASKRQRIVVIGAGFGGLYAVKNLRKLSLDITIVDRRNYHLFQPLLYQVATGGLSPGDISSPVRAVFRKNANVRVLKCEALDVDVQQKVVKTSHGELPYDTLIVATGSSYHHFGHAEWATRAPALKTVEDALHIRARVLQAFESAELEQDPAKREALLHFVIVGGGPTGVELAGALGELTRRTLKRNFRAFRPETTRVTLVEGADRLLPAYPPDLSAKAAASLRRLGVNVMTQTQVTDVRDNRVALRKQDQELNINSQTVLWAAGVQGSAFGKLLAQKTGARLDRGRRLHVAQDLSLPDYPDIFVIGDLAHFEQPEGEPLPGVAPVAMQQGRYVARLIRARLKGRDMRGFRYWNKGNLAVIGRNAAVADMGRLRFSGFFAWLLWALVHIRYLVEYDNKFLVLFQWAWNYFTRKRGARLITDAPQDTKT